MIIPFLFASRYAQADFEAVDIVDRYPEPSGDITIGHVDKKTGSVPIVLRVGKRSASFGLKPKRKQELDPIVTEFTATTKLDWRTEGARRQQVLLEDIRVAKAPRQGEGISARGIYRKLGTFGPKGRRRGMPDQTGRDPNKSTPLDRPRGAFEAGVEHGRRTMTVFDLLSDLLSELANANDSVDSNSRHTRNIVIQEAAIEHRDKCARKVIERIWKTMRMKGLAPKKLMIEDDSED